MDRTRLLISDLDGTLVGDDGALARFATWYAEAKDVTLVYATGRSEPSVRELIAETELPDPHLMIVNVGTEIRDFSTGRELEAWRLRSIVAFDDELIRRTLGSIAGLVPQPPRFQTRRKVSYYYPHASRSDLEMVREKLQAAGLATDVIYSSSRDLDVLPHGVNKGTAARFVADLYGISDDDVLVAGDTGNDELMFEQGFRGVVVGNARPELHQLASKRVLHAQSRHADGVLEGIRHWTQETAGA